MSGVEVGYTPIVDRATAPLKARIAELEAVLCDLTYVSLDGRVYVSVRDDADLSQKHPLLFGLHMSEST